MRYRSIGVLAGALFAATVTAPLLAQTFVVPFENDRPENPEFCNRTIVTGLDPQGDGFLAVRTGPGTGYDKIDELHQNDTVCLEAVNGDWFGVRYGGGDSTDGTDFPYGGWVHRNWIEIG